jgi:hypothetical protein
LDLIDCGIREGNINTGHKRAPFKYCQRNTLSKHELKPVQKETGADEPVVSGFELYLPSDRV